MALGVVDVDRVGKEPHLHPLVPETTVDGIGVVTHADGTEAADPYLQTRVVFQASGGHCAQDLQLLGQLILAPSIELLQDLAQEGGVVVSRSKVTAAAQHQALPNRPMEAMVALLDVAIFVRAARVGFASLETIVVQQTTVAARKVLGMVELLHGRREAVGLMRHRYPTQLPQCILQTGGQRLEALGETDPCRLPVGVGQHEVIDHVLEGLTLDRDPQR